jgi:hypothetical protein
VTNRRNVNCLAAAAAVGANQRNVSVLANNLDTRIVMERRLILFEQLDRKIRIVDNVHFEYNR